MCNGCRYKKSTAKMRWKWKKKNKEVAAKRRKMRAMAK